MRKIWRSNGRNIVRPENKRIGYETEVKETGIEVDRTVCHHREVEGNKFIVNTLQVGEVMTLLVAKVVGKGKVGKGKEDAET